MADGVLSANAWLHQLSRFLGCECLRPLVACASIFKALFFSFPKGRERCSLKDVGLPCAVGGIALEAFFGCPRYVYVAANRMKIHREVFVVEPVVVAERVVVVASVVHKPIGNISSRELADAPTVPNSQFDTPCPYAAYDFNVAFAHVTGLSRRERSTPSFYSGSQLA